METPRSIVMPKINFFELEPLNIGFYMQFSMLSKKKIVSSFETGLEMSY